MVIAPQEQEQAQTAALGENEASVWNEKITVKQEAREPTSAEQPVMEHESYENETEEIVVKREAEESFLMVSHVKEESCQSNGSGYDSCETDEDKSHRKQTFKMSVGSSVSSSDVAGNVDSDGLANIVDSKLSLEESEVSRPAEKHRRISSDSEEPFEPRHLVKEEKDAEMNARREAGDNVTDSASIPVNEDGNFEKENNNCEDGEMAGNVNTAENSVTDGQSQNSKKKKKKKKKNKKKQSEDAPGEGASGGPVHSPQSQATECLELSIELSAEASLRSISMDSSLSQTDSSVAGSGSDVQVGRYNPSTASQTSQMDISASGDSRKSYAAATSGGVLPQAEASGKVDGKKGASSATKSLTDVSIQNVPKSTSKSSAPNKSNEKGKASKQDETSNRQTDAGGATGVQVDITYCSCFMKFIGLILK